MYDSDYIKLSERGSKYPIGSSSAWLVLANSHAVADDIARELAEALRDCLSFNGRKGGPKQKSSLARYDKVMKGTDN